ncbi:MAG: ABC transporter substrate-binding protein, partial [Chloroflexales bacterium]
MLQAFSLEDLDTILNIYEPLVWLDPQWKLQPRLATAWEPSEGGKVWTFKLREGVSFHHGTPFTAADVVHSIKRLKDPALGPNFAANVALIDTVEAVDDLTVRFHLTIPYASLPALLSVVPCTIVPHDRSEDENSKAPMGTGPFRLKEHVAGERMVCADARHLRQRRQRSAAGLPVSGGRGQRQGEQRRVVLRRPPGGADRPNLGDGAATVGGDAAGDRQRVLAGEGALGGVVAASIVAQHQEAAQARP